MPGIVSATSAIEWVHRSDRGYAAHIFACQNANCSQYYGDGTYGGTPVTDATAATATEQEIWVLEDVYDLEDSDRVIDDYDANASAALFYPAGFTHANKLGIWWSEPSDPETIYFQGATTPGWQSWNTYDDWTDPYVVVQGANEAANMYRVPSHPWVVAATDGERNFIRMFLQAAPLYASDFQIIRIDSDDDDGTDFLLQCTDDYGCCTDPDGCDTGDDPELCNPDELCDFLDISATGDAAVTEIYNDETSAYITRAGHGRIAWDYIAGGAVDFSEDNPMMVFTGQIDGDCDDFDGLYGTDEIFQTVWDDYYGVWAFDGFLDTSDCALAQVLNMHDPGVIPLPNNEFKMYIANNTSTPIHVYYWNGVEWGDEATIEFRFDDGTRLSAPEGVVPDGCLENIDVIVHIQGGAIHEGAFLKADPVGSPEDTGDSGDTGGGSPCFSPTGGIVFAEHRN